MSGQKTVFARDATGLVRQIGLLDNFAINYGSVPISTTIAIYLSWIAWRFPAADIGMTYIIAGIVMIGQTMSYAFLTAAMPRSGGEYIFQSRILHPALGFASSAIIWYGSSGMLLASFGLLFIQWLTGNFAVISLFGNAPQLTAFATSLTAPNPTFILGTILLVVTALVAFRSTKAIVKAQVVAMIISTVSMLVGLFFVVSTSNQDFVSIFNKWFSPYSPGVPDLYHHLISVAESGGLVVPPIAISATVMALGINFLWAAYFQWSTYTGGEFKGATNIKRQTISMLGCQIFVCVICAVIAYAMVNTIGREFLSSTFYLFNYNAAALPLPVSPSPSLFMILCAGGNVWLAVLITIGFLATLAQLILLGFLGTVRMQFAWAFDRVAPTWLADLHPKYGTPWKNILLLLVLSLVYYVAYVWGPPWFYSYIWTASYFAMIVMTFLFTGVAAVVYSTTKKWKTAFEASPCAKYKLAGIPWMAIFGVWSVIVMVLMAGIYLADPSYGMTWDFGIPYNIAMVIVPIVIFYAVRAYRKRQGIDLDLAFKAIPPE